MKRLAGTLRVSLLCLPLTAGTLVLAQPPEREPGRGRPPEGPGRPGGPPLEILMRAVPVLNALDADSDGTISAEEIANAPAALKTVDKNGDGQLTGDELRAEFPGRGGPFGGGPGLGFGPGPGGPGPGPGGPGGPGVGGRPGGPGGFGPPGGRGRGGPPEGRGPGDQRPRNEDRRPERLSADELTSALRGLVMQADADRDGFVTGDELIAQLRRGADREQSERAPGDGDRPNADQPRGDRPGSDRPRGERSESDRPSGEQTSGEQPGGDQPNADRAEAAPSEPDQARRFGFGGPPGSNPREFFERMFASRDRDSDGLLKGDEIPEPMRERVAQVDRDGDGAISKQEMEGMMARMREGGGPPGRGGDRRPGDRRPGDDGGRPGGDLPRRPPAEAQPPTNGDSE